MESKKITNGTLRKREDIANFSNSIIEKHPLFNLTPFATDLKNTKKRLGYVLSDLSHTLYFSYHCDDDHHAILLHNNMNEIEYFTDYQKRNTSLHDPLKGQYDAVCNYDNQIVYNYSGQLLAHFNKISSENNDYEKISDLVLLDNGLYIVKKSEIKAERKWTKYYLYSKNQSEKQAMEINENDYNNLIDTYNIVSKNLFLKSDAVKLKNPNMDFENYGPTLI